MVHSTQSRRRYLWCIFYVVLCLIVEGTLSPLLYEGSSARVQWNRFKALERIEGLVEAENVAPSVLA